jgi:hypothetical protein
MSLPLPESRDLWFAKTAEEWRNVYLEVHNAETAQLSSLLDCVSDLAILIELPSTCDLELTIHLVVYATWTLVLEYRRSWSVGNHTGDIQPGTELEKQLSFQHQRPFQILMDLKRNLEDHDTGNSSETLLILELFHLCLSAPMDILQSLAGKYGEEESQRAYLKVRKWAKGGSFPQALLHAGQVIRLFRLVPRETLREIDAIAVYFGALTLWAAGILANSPTTSPAKNSLSEGLSSAPQLLVALDADPNDWVLKAYVTTGEGLPCIRSTGVNDEIDQVGDDAMWMTETAGSKPNMTGAPLNKPAAVMKVIIQILEDGFRWNDNREPFLVGNLLELITELARVVERF